MREIVNRLMEMADAFEKRGEILLARNCRTTACAILDFLAYHAAEDGAKPPCQQRFQQPTGARNPSVCVPAMSAEAGSVVVGNSSGRGEP